MCVYDNVWASRPQAFCGCETEGREKGRDGCARLIAFEFVCVFCPHVCMMRRSLYLRGHGMRKADRRRAALAAAIAGVFGAVSGASAGSIYTESNLGAPGASPHFVALVDADLHRPLLVMFQWGKSVLAGPTQGSFDLRKGV